MFKVWVQMLRGPAQSHGRCEPSNHAAALPARPWCLSRYRIGRSVPLRQVQMAAVHAQNLSCESGTQVISSGTSAQLLSEVRRTGKPLNSYAEQALPPERPLSMHNVRCISGQNGLSMKQACS